MTDEERREVKRTVIQIVEIDGQVHALCDDGSIWKNVVASDRKASMWFPMSLPPGCQQ